jgi:hypothetical protein
VFHDQKQ